MIVQLAAKIEIRYANWEKLPFLGRLHIINLKSPVNNYRAETIF